MLLDRFISDWHVRSRHEANVSAGAAETYRAARQLDLGRSLPVAALFALRAVPHFITRRVPLRRRLTWDAFLDLGFVSLAEEPGAEFVMGAVGKFWRPDSGIVRIDPSEFAEFDEPGFAKGAMSLTVHELGSHGTLLATETRVACTDAAARRNFSLYWRVIEPFSGLIRTFMLNEVKRSAEAA